MMYLTKHLYTAFALAFFALSSILSAHAGILRIVNENTDPIILYVIPEPSSEQAPCCWKCLTGACDMPRKNIVDLITPSTCPSECVMGVERFAVLGTTGGFLFNGKCKNLSIHKNYEITFSNDFVGTSCISREI